MSKNIISIWCRLFHAPISYPMASWGHWHYSHCNKCDSHRWSWRDRITGWLRGYEFGRRPGIRYGPQRRRAVLVAAAQQEQEDE